MSVFVPATLAISVIRKTRLSDAASGASTVGMNSLLFVSGAGLVAGAMNALAGGGSFVSLPALIAVGVPSVQANASSTVALFPGGVASVWAYRDGLGPVGAVSLRALLITTLIGGVVGAVLLLSTPTQTFDFVLPWLLLVACLALGFGRSVGEWLRRRGRIAPVAVLTVQFGLGIYGGYFGGAVGIMMMAVWGLFDSRDLEKPQRAAHDPRQRRERDGRAHFHHRARGALAGNTRNAWRRDHRRIWRRAHRAACAAAHCAFRNFGSHGGDHRGVFRAGLFEALSAGGRGGIRTHETLAGLPVFKTGAFNRSTTRPDHWSQGLSKHPLSE